MNIINKNLIKIKITGNSPTSKGANAHHSKATSINRVEANGMIVKRPK